MLHHLILVVLTGCLASAGAYSPENLSGDQTNTGNNKTKDFVKSIERSNMTAVQEKLKLYRDRKMQTLAVQARLTGDENVVENRKTEPRDKVRKEGDSLLEINTKANLTDYMYQADILLTEEQVDQLLSIPNENATRGKRQAYKDIFYPSTIWNDDTVYYYFHKSTTSTVRRVFKKAVAFWRKNTCLKFKKSNTAKNRLKVFRGQGCYSYIGKLGGVQEFSLGEGCGTVGTAAHELGHALGFFHTQSRYDRDKSISVKYKNIMKDFVDQFDKETKYTNDNYGMPYDYGSIMQYGGLSASKNEYPTMTATDYLYQDTMGSDIVGFYDVSMINEHYNCKAKCPPSTSAKCVNGGFPKPRSCDKCICPSGYGGKLCDRRPSGCGATLAAKNSFQTLHDELGDGSSKIKQNFKKCHYWIKAPAGSKIEIVMDSFDGVHLDGCIYGGVEIKTQKDQKLTGYRFCSLYIYGTKLTSHSNIVPVITFNKYLTSRTVLRYRIAREISEDDTMSPDYYEMEDPTMYPDYYETGDPFLYSDYYEMGVPSTYEYESSDSCFNVYDRSECDLYYEEGFCDNRDVRRLCKKSCGAC